MAQLTTGSSILNNLALAYAMDGHAEKAEPMLREAALSANADPKVSHNLALVLGLQGKTEDAKSVVLKTGATEESTEDAATIKQMVGAGETRPQAQAIATGSTNREAKPAKAAAKSKSKPAPQAQAEDPAIAVQRLADGFAATPPDAPVQLTPKR